MGGLLIYQMMKVGINKVGESLGAALPREERKAMNNSNISEEQAQLGTNVRVEEVSGFSLTKKTTIKDLMDSIKELAEINYRAGGIVSMSCDRPLNQRQVFSLMVGNNVIASFKGIATLEYTGNGYNQYQARLYKAGNYSHSWFITKVERWSDYVKEETKE